MGFIDIFRPITGRLLRENSSTINIADNLVAATDITNGGIKVTPLFVELARGNVPNATPFSSYGKYVATTAVTNQIIWPDGTYKIPPANGIQISIVSTSANDANGGTGINSLEIHYLDNNLIPCTETVTLNGLTPVTTVATNIRFIQCAHIVTAGNLKAAAGTITFTNSGNIYDQIEATSRRCVSSAKMVPAGKKLFVAGAVGGSVSGTAAAGAQIKISSTYFDGHDLTSQLIFQPFGSIGLQDTSIAYTFPIPAGPFPAGSIVAMEVTVDKAATITGDWFGWLENA